MAIINNNVQNVKFLRNQNVSITRGEAISLLNEHKGEAADGTALLARYTVSGEVKTIVGFVYVTGETHDITIFDTEGASGDVEKLREEINAKFGTDFISSSNTVEANLTALSGNAQSTSAETSVAGAKKYAEELISELDGSVTAEAGSYVKSVTEVDGKISGTTEALPSFADTAVAKNFVKSVSETAGQISVERGSISSSAQTIVLNDNNDGGIDFDVNIDGQSIVKDASGVLSVASTALTQYFGDEKTIHAEVDAATNKKTFNTLLKIVKNTNPSSTEVKEEYFLADADGTAITGADTIKIYKDSHIVSITYITDSGDTHYQNLEYKYIDASGATKTEYVDISSLVLEAEFASGVTITNHIAHGVVDPQSEKDGRETGAESFLTVGADGFKISGINAEIDRRLNAVVENLDATVTDTTSGNHVTIRIEELDGKLVQSGLTIEENDIASATDLAALSAKTVTALTSTNGSITAQINDAAGNKSYNIETDASKIKMSGFNSTGALSGITTSSSITEAFGEVESVIEANERVTAEALNNLNTRINTVSGDVETISGNVNTISGNVNTISGDVDTLKANYVSGATVNGSGVTVTGHIIPLTIVSAASTGATSSPLTVTTAQGGGVTLTFDGLDCGYYDGTQG